MLIAIIFTTYLCYIALWDFFIDCGLHQQKALVYCFKIKHFKPVNLTQCICEYFKICYCIMFVSSLDYNIGRAIVV